MTDAQTPDFEALLATDPWSVAMMALEHKARTGEAPGGDLADAAQQAGIILASVALLRGGAQMEQLDEMWTGDRDFTIGFSYDQATDTLGLDIRWDDGEEISVGGLSKDATPSEVEEAAVLSKAIDRACGYIWQGLCRRAVVDGDRIDNAEEATRYFRAVLDDLRAAEGFELSKLP